MSISDIIIVAVLVAFMLNGYKKGFVKAVYSAISLLATFLVMVVFKDTLVPVIAKSQIGISLGEFFAGKTEDMLIINKCSSAFVYLTSYIILYFVIKLVLKLAIKVIDTLASLPLISSVNKLLGACAGIILGFVWVVIVLNVLYIFPQTKDFVLSSQIADYFRIIFI